MEKPMPASEDDRPEKYSETIEDVPGMTADTTFNDFLAGGRPGDGVPVRQYEEPETDDSDAGRTVPLDPLPDEVLPTLVMSSRPQPAEELLPTVRAVHHCHIGLVRSRNEDSSYVLSTSTGGQEPLMPFGLFIVADGMGGHYAGHEASKNVSRLVAKHVLERIYLPLLQNSTNLPSLPQEPIQEVVLEAVQAANLAIHNPDPDKDTGTTLTAALIFGRRLYLAHVGDSRAYIYDGDQLKQITTDHSYVRRLQEAGQLTEEEAASHPQRNMLYMAVGQGSRLDIDTFTQSLPKRGRLLLCSDGLWGLVPEPVLKQHLAKDKPLQETADELVKLALIAGGHDNITVVLVDFAL